MLVDCRVQKGSDAELTVSRGSEQLWDETVQICDLYATNPCFIVTEILLTLTRNRLSGRVVPYNEVHTRSRTVSSCLRGSLPVSQPHVHRSNPDLRSRRRCERSHRGIFSSPRGSVLRRFHSKVASIRVAGHGVLPVTLFLTHVFVSNVS